MTTDNLEAIDLRIVVHGASGAGKSTTARRLASRFDKPVTSVEDDEGRTQYFDWLEHVGGNVDGRPVRLQFVTVPGHLTERSQHLVELADVVLFVVDTTAARLAESIAVWEGFRRWRAGRDKPPVVVQLNKRDDPDAVPLEEVRSLLALDGAETVVETSAIEGSGISIAFVSALRTGLDARGTDERTDEVISSEHLLDHLQRRETGPTESVRLPRHVAPPPMSERDLIATTDAGGRRRDDTPVEPQSDEEPRWRWFNRRRPLPE